MGKFDVVACIIFSQNHRQAHAHSKGTVVVMLKSVCIVGIIKAYIKQSYLKIYKNSNSNFHKEQFRMRYINICFRLLFYNPRGISISKQKESVCFHLLWSVQSTADQNNN